MRITRAQTPDDLVAASHLFDRSIDPDATLTFLAREGHWLLLAHEDEHVVGFASGAEVVHPDKGAEMFLNELGVQEEYRGRGIGTALVRELAELARHRGCTGMWVATEPDNVAAVATYRRAGATEPDPAVVLAWTFDE